MKNELSGAGSHVVSTASDNRLFVKRLLYGDRIDIS